MKLNNFEVISVLMYSLYTIHYFLRQIIAYCYQN